MTQLIKLLSGEDTRIKMEGLSASDILQIMSEPSSEDESSPFAQVLGEHIYSTEGSPHKRVSYIVKKGKKR